MPLLTSLMPLCYRYFAKDDSGACPRVEPRCEAFERLETLEKSQPDSPQAQFDQVTSA